MNLSELMALTQDAANTTTFRWRGHQITVRGLTAAEQLEVSRLVDEAKGAPVSPLVAFAVRCMTNGTGPICPPEDAERVAAGLPADLVNKAWAAVAKLSGIGEADSQEIELDFTSGQRGPS